jgi:hypothetical protein
MPIPHVPVRGRVRASHQNLLIDQVNQNTTDISNLQAGGVPAEEVQQMIDASVTTHVNDTSPHPAYDDIPSLTVLFENGLA